MERSEVIGDLIAALAKAQAEFTVALKDSANPYYNSRYADLATIIAATRPALSKHGIAVTHACGTDLERQVAIVTTTIHLGEQWIASTAEAPAVGKAKDGGVRFDAQTIGAAWTYMRRYSLQGLLGLASEDDDGNVLVTEKATTPPAIQKEFPPRPAIQKEFPSSAQRQQWAELFRECDTLDEFNFQIVPLAKERGKEFIVMMAEEAKRRGYVGDRSTGLYVEKSAK